MSERIETSPVSFADFRKAEGLFWAEINRLLDGGAKRICDVGGGARPILSAAQIREHELDYVILDESREQLDRAPEGYQQVRASILDRAAVSELARERGGFDAVISRWTAEHIPDGRAFHERVLELLRPGGTAVHLFPTLYAVPFLVNRVLSPTMSAAVLFRAYSARKVKFRPYYSWCRGPSEKRIRRLQEMGYTVESYTGFFGHTFYARVKPVHRLHQRFVRRLVSHPHANMTSFALVVLKRPG
jgi:SAM-dependent methyltransferase